MNKMFVVEEYCIRDEAMRGLFGPYSKSKAIEVQQSLKSNHDKQFYFQMNEYIIRELESYEQEQKEPDYYPEDLDPNEPFKGDFNV